MSAPKHSLLPWHIHRTDQCRIIDNTGRNVARIGSLSRRDSRILGLDEANARLLVTAVNAHADLLAAGKEALRLLGVNEMLEAAIAKAEEPQP